MKKLGLLLCASGTLVLAACSAGASQLKSLPERDRRIIVEVDRDIDTVNEEGAKNSQRAVYNNIKTTAKILHFIKKLPFIFYFFY